MVMMSLYTTKMTDIMIDHFIRDVHPKLKRFVEEIYCVEYSPMRIRPQYHKNTKYHKYFVFMPTKSGWGESEFYYDIQTQKFTRVQYPETANMWDSSYDDTFS